LNKPPKIYPKGKLQENLVIFYKKYGDKFDATYNKKKLTFSLEKVKFYDSTVEFFRLTYDNKFIDELHHIAISFYDGVEKKKNNVGCIESIRKNSDFRGTELVNIAIIISRMMGATILFLNDATYFLSKKRGGGGEKRSLSTQTLIDSGETYYQKFGFEFWRKSCSFHYAPSNTSIQSWASNIIRKMRKITLVEVINYIDKLLHFITNIIRDPQRYNKTLEMKTISQPFYSSFEKNDFILIEGSEILHKLLTISFHCSEIIAFIGHLPKKSKTMKFYEIITLANKEGFKYDEIIHFVCYYRGFIISYDSKKITNEIFVPFYMLYHISHDFDFYIKL
jgi:hypothetical protein